jgi:hypothetical protein
MTVTVCDLLGVEWHNGVMKVVGESQLDDVFFERADAHIDLSNRHTAEAEIGPVSASMMYATARFNSWVSACGFNNGEEMAEARSETIEYFVKQYRLMLEDNLDDYIHNFDRYMKRPENR